MELKEGCVLLGGMEGTGILLRLGLSTELGWRREPEYCYDYD